METATDFIFLDSKITANGDGNHEIKRCLLLGRKAMTILKVKVKSLSHVWLFSTPWTVVCQAPSSVGCSRQELWSGLPFPSPEYLLDQGLNPVLPHCRQTLYSQPSWNPVTNLGSIFKRRDCTLLTEVHIVKAMVFPVVMYGCESWPIRKAEHWTIDAFELWCWIRLLSPLDCRHPTCQS